MATSRLEDMVRQVVADGYSMIPVDSPKMFKLVSRKRKHEPKDYPQAPRNSPELVKAEPLSKKACFLCFRPQLLLHVGETSGTATSSPAGSRSVLRKEERGGTTLPPRSGTGKMVRFVLPSSPNCSLGSLLAKLDLSSPSATGTSQEREACSPELHNPSRGVRRGFRSRSPPPPVPPVEDSDSDDDEDQETEGRQLTSRLRGSQKHFQT